MQNNKNTCFYKSMACCWEMRGIDGTNRSRCFLPSSIYLGWFEQLLFFLERRTIISKKLWSVLLDPIFQANSSFLCNLNSFSASIIIIAAWETLECNKRICALFLKLERFSKLLKSLPVNYLIIFWRKRGYDLRAEIIKKVIEATILVRTVSRLVAWQISITS